MRGYNLFLVCFWRGGERIRVVSGYYEMVYAGSLVTVDFSNQIYRENLNC